MIAACILSGLTCLTMILSVLFKPTVSIGKIKTDTYWIVVLIGAVLMTLTGGIKVNDIISAFTADNATNPLKILILFISMTLISIFLDEIGFFRYLANRTLKKAKTSQTKLFLFLYFTVSVLTVFTSNDIIILSFTPFICYFSKNAKVNPLPYLAAEFVAANTWSMALIIGNPTNIYLSTEYGIDFISYLSVMILPTVFSGIIALLMLFLMFFKMLKEPIKGTAKPFVLREKLLLIVGIAHLTVCTVLLAVSSYIGLEMWKIALFSMLSLYACGLIIALLRRQRPANLLNCVKRAPWPLIPFVLSMFVIILSLTEKGVTGALSSFFGSINPVLKYGIGSFVSANLINNIPMSVLFGAIIEPLSGPAQTKAVYAAVIGSNIGAFLTPIGALAGIMWSKMIGEQQIKFGYRDFLNIGLKVAVPTIAVALIVLSFIL